MHFGVGLPHFRRLASTEAIVTVAQQAEALGFDSVWVSDHIVVPRSAIPRFGEVFFEPFTTLAYVAGKTQRIRLGTSVIILPYRHPLFMGKALATLDVLSGGRLIVGAAVGWLAEEFEALGIPFTERGARSDEALKVMRALWTETEPRFEGRFFRFSGIKAEPKPLQKPHPPIWIGGNSPGAFRRAAEFADAWHPSHRSVEEIAAGARQFKALAKARGRDPNSLEIVARAPLRVITNGDAPEPRPLLVGAPEQIVKDIGMYKEAGVTGFMFDTYYGNPAVNDQDLGGVLATLETFATQVRPRLKRGDGRSHRQEKDD
jgi:probable F420-dependent oxidoreductase